MLTVPHLKPGQTPFDPALDNLILPSPTSEYSSPSPDLQPSPTDLLNHAIVKDTLTSLHQEDDENFDTLQTYSALKLYTMEKEHKTFLQSQKHKFLNSLPDPNLKQLFLTLTKPYFDWSLQRVTNLYLSKINSYRNDVIERQNAEFVNLALKPENAFNDALQTRYRDMILFNLDTLYEDVPNEERKNILDKAEKTFYRKIIEKRLELDPSSIDSILNAAVVRRTLPSDEIDTFTLLASEAVRQDEWKRQAQRWVDEKIDQEEVKRKIVSTTKTDEERNAFQAIYDRIVCARDRKECLAAILNTINVWNIVIENGGRVEDIPLWVDRVNPVLKEYIVEALERRERCGGRGEVVNYLFVLDFIERFEAGKGFGEICEEKKLYLLIEKAGGVESEVFGVLLRFIVGAKEEGDEKWIEDFLVAREVLKERGGEEGNEFLRRFGRIRQMRMAKGEGKGLDELEIRKILTEMLI